MIYRAKSIKGDVTRNDSQRRFLAQHNVTTLLLYCLKNGCSIVPTFEPFVALKRSSLRIVPCNITLGKTHLQGSPKLVGERCMRDRPREQLRDRLHRSL